MVIRRDSIEAIDFDGLRIYDYTQGLDLGSSLAVIDVPPGGRHSRSWSRRSDKYYLVLEGDLRFVIDERPYDLHARDFCWVGKGQRFSYENPSSDPARLLLVHTPSFDLESEVFEEPLTRGDRASG